MNTLNPAINKSVWTSEEESALKTLHEQYGPKWTLIAKALGTNRTDNCVKNHWNSKHRRVSGLKRQLPGTPLEQDSPPSLENLPLVGKKMKSECGVDVICDVINNDDDVIEKVDSNDSNNNEEEDSEFVSLNEVNELLMFIEAAGKDKKMEFSETESPNDEIVDFEMMGIKGNVQGNVIDMDDIDIDDDDENDNNNNNGNNSEYWFPLNTF